MDCLQKMEIKDNHYEFSTINIVQNNKKIETSKFHAFPNIEDNAVDRGEEVAQLLELLHQTPQDKENSSACRQVLITGIGGIGKTYLAIQCAKLWIDQGVFEHAVFVNMQTMQTAEDHFSDLAELLEGRRQRLTIPIVQTVYSHYNKHKSLFVLDNIEQGSYISKFLPMPTETNIYVLGTSQYNEYIHVFKHWPLRELNEIKSRRFIQHKIDKYLPNTKLTENEHKLINILITKLEGHPLSILHAIIHIIFEIKYEEETMQNSLKNYIEKFNEFCEDPFPDQFCKEMHKPIFQSLYINIEKAVTKDKDANTLLCCLAYLDPSGIKKCLFEHRTCYFKQGISKPLRWLKKYSLVEMNKNEDLVYMHRLVQTVCRIKNTKEKEIIKILLHLLNVKNSVFNVNFIFLLQHITLTVECFSELYVNSFCTENINGNKMPNVSTETFMINRALLLAAWYGCFPVIKWLSERGKVNINCTDSHGNTPLHHMVASSNSSRVVTELLNHGANKKLKNNRGENPLLLAAKVGNWGAVRPLLDTEVVNMPMGDKIGSTLLHAAARDDSDACVKILIKNGANIDVQDERGDTPLLAAVKAGRWSMVDILLELGAKLDNVSMSDINILLHIAVQGEGDMFVKRLMKRTNGANKEMVDYYTPLLAAARAGNWSIVDVMFEHGVEVNDVPINDVCTLLHLAARDGRDLLVKKIFDNHVNTTKLKALKDEKGKPPLLTAVEAGNWSTVDVILDYGAELDNVLMSDGSTLLHLAARDGRDLLVKKLFDNVVNITKLRDMKDEKGKTPLLAAVEAGNWSTVNVILLYGAELDNVLMADSTRLLHAAAQNNCTKFIEILIKHGADVEARDEQGNTPLVTATKARHRNAVHTLLKNGAKQDSVNSPVQRAVRMFHGVCNFIWPPTDRRSGLLSGHESD